MVEPVRWQPAYVGLGANLGRPLEQLAGAVAALEQISGAILVSVSPVYRSRPMGPQDQPDYVNAVAGLLVQLEPLALLEALQAIENRMGRVREGERWGPRTLDLDLLVYSDRVMHEPRLTLPHPGVHERSFVLYPLADIAPALQVPGRGRVDALVATVPGDDLQRLDDRLIS